MAAFALVMDVVATAWGLGLAVDLGAVAITIMSIATLVFAEPRARTALRIPFLCLCRGRLPAARLINKKP
jgi:hypothetical protein